MAILEIEATEKNFAKGFSWFQRIFTLKNDTQTILVILISTSTLERLILATKIIQIGQSGLKLEPFFQSRLPEILSPKNFSWFFIIFTIEIFTRSILVIIKRISMYELMILATKIIKIGQLRQKLEAFF